MAISTALNAVKECSQPMVNARTVAHLEVSPIYKPKFANNALQPAPLATIFTLITASPAKIAVFLSIAANALKNVLLDLLLTMGIVQMDNNANQLQVVDYVPIQDSAMSVSLTIMVSLIANIKTQCLQH